LFFIGFLEMLNLPIANVMSTPRKVILNYGAISDMGVYSPTNNKTASLIAGSTIIYEEDLTTIDKLYPSISVVDSIKWSQISYAHTILTPNGDYFLVLLAGPNFFNEYEGLFIPLEDGSTSNSSLSNTFSSMLLNKINMGQISCYPGDLQWLK
jgi:hypothetical protein